MNRIVIACLLGTVSLTGCLSPGSLLRQAGVGPPAEGPEQPLERVALTQNGRVVLSGYQHAPTLDWSTLGIGQPFSLTRGLFDSADPHGPCRLVPRGAPEVAHVPYGAERQPLLSSGVMELGVAGNIAPALALMSNDPPTLGLQSVATSARLGTLGDRCGYAYLYLSLGRSGSERVMVNR